MTDIFNEKHQNLYEDYNFKKITHEDALYIYLKITELQICKECYSIKDIQNIKTKCTKILNTLDKYKTNEE